jgi:hypothetical protein
MTNDVRDQQPEDWLEELYILFFQTKNINGEGKPVFTSFKIMKKLHSVAVVRKRTIQTERPPLVGEVSANLCG